MMQCKEPLLILDDIHASYIQKEILRGLSLNLFKGEIVALLGENGSGKSTTLKVIAGLLASSRGSVKLNGRELTGLGAGRRQKLGVGFLMQGGRVFPNLSVEENFTIALSQLPRTNRRIRIKLGDWFSVLTKRKNSRAGLLSGGQRQMLAIEMILAQNPSLILLDEPTAALSADVGNEILSKIKDYTRTYEAGVLLVEQNTVAATNIANRTLHISLGQSQP